MKTSEEILISYEAAACKKTEMAAWKMVLSGVLAGLFIALGGLGSQMAQTAIGGTAGRIVGACVFPVGLFLVVTVGVELFTGNCLLPAPWLNRGKTQVKLSGILKNWIFVYIGNFIGSFLLSLMVVGGHIDTMLDNKLGETMINTATSKMSLCLPDAIIRGILCNILVCLAVWVAMGCAELGGKAIAVILPVMLFVLCGFEHSVANMYFIPTGLLLGASGSIGDFLINNLLPVTLGNIIGGAGFLSVCLWGLKRS